MVASPGSSCTAESQSSRAAAGCWLGKSAPAWERDQCAWLGRDPGGRQRQAPAPNNQRSDQSQRPAPAAMDGEGATGGSAEPVNNLQRRSGVSAAFCSMCRCKWMGTCACSHKNACPAQSSASRRYPKQPGAAGGGGPLWCGADRHPQHPLLARDSLSLLTRSHVGCNRGWPAGELRSPPRL